MTVLTVNERVAFLCWQYSCFLSIFYFHQSRNSFINSSTGGTKQLIRMGSAKIVVGGMPDIAPNTTTVDKVVEASVTDIRYRRRRRSAGTVLGVTTDGRAVKSIDGDLQGLILFHLFKIFGIYIGVHQVYLHEGT